MATNGGRDDLLFPDELGGGDCGLLEGHGGGGESAGGVGDGYTGAGDGGAVTMELCDGAEFDANGEFGAARGGEG